MCIKSYHVLITKWCNFCYFLPCNLFYDQFINCDQLQRYALQNSAVRVRVINSAVRVRFSSENFGILKDCWMKLLDSCVYKDIEILYLAEICKYMNTPHFRTELGPTLDRALLTKIRSVC